tara:strand:- start:854 stop:2485 length:1632 start_codon:yes stop_codon:yes gene_type:complete
MIAENEPPKKKELGSLNDKDLQKILDYYDSKEGMLVDNSGDLTGRYESIRNSWVGGLGEVLKPNINAKNGEIKWSRIDLKKLLGKKNVPTTMYISNGFVAYKVKDNMNTHWRIGDLWMLYNDITKNEGKYDTARGFDLLSEDEDVSIDVLRQGRSNTARGFWNSGWNYVKQGFEDWYKGDLKTYHGEYRQERHIEGEKQKKRFETYNVPERLNEFNWNPDEGHRYEYTPSDHESQIRNVANFNADKWREAFGGADSYEVLKGGLSDPFYNIQWKPPKGANYSWETSITYDDAFGEITNEDIVKEFEGTPIGYEAERNINRLSLSPLQEKDSLENENNISRALFGIERYSKMTNQPVGKNRKISNFAQIKSDLSRNIATFPEDYNERGESINFAQNSKRYTNKDGTPKNKLQWKNDRAVIFNPNSTFQFSRKFGNKKGQSITYVSRKAGDGLVVWREQGIARLAAANARKKGYLIRTVPISGGYVNLMAKRKHYFKGQEWFDEIQHGYTDENKKYLEDRGIRADNVRKRYPSGRPNDYYRRIRR